MDRIKAIGYILAAMGTCFVWELSLGLVDFAISFLLSLADSLFFVLAFLALVEEEANENG